MNVRPGKTLQSRHAPPPIGRRDQPWIAARSCPQGPLLAKTVGEIEANGDVTLASRVDALARSKREVEDRLARIFENFNALDALRKDIGGIFATIRNSLNRIG